MASSSRPRPRRPSWPPVGFEVRIARAGSVNAAATANPGWDVESVFVLSAAEGSERRHVRR